MGSGYHGPPRRRRASKLEDENLEFTNTIISKATFNHPPLYPLPSREGQFLSPLSLEGRGQG